MYLGSFRGSHTHTLSLLCSPSIRPSIHSAIQPSTWAPPPPITAGQTYPISLDPSIYCPCDHFLDCHHLRVSSLRFFWCPRPGPDSHLQHSLHSIRSTRTRTRTDRQETHVITACLQTDLVKTTAGRTICHLLVSYLTRSLARTHARTRTRTHASSQKPRRFTTTTNTNTNRHQSQYHNQYHYRNTHH